MSTSPFSKTAVEIRLIQLAARGNSDAFAALFHKHFQAVYSFAVHLCGDPSLADDLTQETFIRARSNLNRFGPPWKLRPWLFHTARNLFLDHYRRERKTAELRKALADQQPGPERRALSHELAARVRGALRGLPSAHREVLVLREMEGLSYAEIAAVLGVSLDNVKVMLHRARASFKAAYGLRILTEDPLPDCPVLAELLDAEHDGQVLPEEQQRLLRTHLSECPACQQRQRELTALSALLVLPPFAPPAGLDRRILDPLETGPGPRPGRSGRRGRLSRTGMLAGGGLALLFVVLGTLLFQGDSQASTGSGAALPASPTPLSTSAVLFHTTTPNPVLPIQAPPSQSASSLPSPSPTATSRPATLTPTVAPPTWTPTATPDAVGPVISKVQPSQSTIFTGPGTCSPAAAVITVTVSDPSGVESVLLIYAHTTFGSIPMTQGSGSTWQAALGPFPAVGDGTVDYQIRAYDAAGNFADTTFKTIIILLCTG
jgi:RNA polymerase sigma-70 factor (ECF subfamily)